MPTCLSHSIWMFSYLIQSSWLTTGGIYSAIAVLILTNGSMLYQLLQQTLDLIHSSSHVIVIHVLHHHSLWFTFPSPSNSHPFSSVLKIKPRVLTHRVSTLLLSPSANLSVTLLKPVSHMYFYLFLLLLCFLDWYHLSEMVLQYLPNSLSLSHCPSHDWNDFKNITTQ